MHTQQQAQNTLPMGAARPPSYATRPPGPPPVLPRMPAAAHKPRPGIPLWLIAVVALGVSTVFAGVFALILGVSLVNGDNILPGVRVGGVSVGGLSVIEAEQRLTRQWPVVLLQDRATDRQWQIEPARLGLIVDPAASAARAFGYGRVSGNAVAGILGASVTPVLTFDPEAARSGLASLADQVTQPAVDAQIALVDGRVQALPARDGRAIDVEGTAELIATDPVGWLEHGEIPMRMVALAPAITDAAPMVAAAEALLANPLTIDVYDPRSGGVSQWTAAPQSWAGWLRAASDSNAPGGLRLSLEDDALRGFLAQGQARLENDQYIDVDAVVERIQAAIGQRNPRVTARVYHRDRQRVVVSGETIISIAYDEGVPYPWIQQANGGIQLVNAGQTITIPSVDHFMPFEPVPGKRIIVSLSQQRVWVYENGAVKWEWPASTGISSSPTWPGIYQIISHVPNAYAGNWNLWMPNFMGVYQPIPGADFTNGFHGFPTRGGGQILWENSLGTRVTYGCILLSNTNIQQLYEWAEDGVVVEIRA
ncbi:MAG: L,D-transpeptidase family protein [Chloroflexi bacterium]|nr:L,D-transpeptidase family protein [Chloroflexota bacterium]